MGTRADFYVGRGDKAEWLGSIALDGYPSGNVAKPEYGPVLRAVSEPEFRERVGRMLAGLRHGTRPEDGWPWPWKTSLTTDYSYAFDAGCVWVTLPGERGDVWVRASDLPLNEAEYPDTFQGELCVFPDMTARQKVTLGERSGLIVAGG